MRTRSILVSLLLTPLLVPAGALANTVHVVTAGETLTSIAATDGLTVSSIAAANHIPVTTELITGELIEIPPLTPATSAVQSTLSSTGTTTASSTGAVAATTTTQATTTTAATTTTTAAVTPTQVITTTKATRTPHPTLQRVNAAEIATVAEANAVPVSLVEAVAWQESGWNNDEQSASGAVGVMQITPSTWRWINRYLTPGDPLNGESAVDNVRAGALLLHQLLVVTGSQRRAIEAYYQGLASLEQNGAYASTKQYVADVLSIEHQLEA